MSFNGASTHPAPTAPSPAAPSPLRRAAASGNRLRHGLLAQAVVLEDEDEALFNSFLTSSS